MEKDYNIDDIINEVKKRQAGTPPENDGEAMPSQPEVTEVPVQEIAEEPEEEYVCVNNAYDGMEEAEPEPVYANTAEEITPEPPKEAENFPEFSAVGESEEAEREKIDLNEMLATNTEEATEADGKQAKKRISKKTLLKIIAVVLALLIALGVGGYFAIDNYLDEKLKDVVDDTNEAVEWQGMDKLVEKFDTIEETDARYISSYKDNSKTWYNNGEPVYSSHVLNVMLIGEDTRGTEIKTDGTRADSAIICSVNIDEKTITLTSILRDIYTYWQDGDGGDHYDKINAAMSKGNVKTYIKTVEQLYKIKIDNYVIVNFTSFENIIDYLGGVTLKLTSKEIREINNHPKRYGNVHIDQEFEGYKGKQKLNGEQALAYCRIRHIDTDNKRADRQKTCIKQVYKDFKNASLSDTIKMIETILEKGYVKTNMPVASIKKLAKYAIKNGWQNYEVRNQNIPEAGLEKKGAGGKHWGAWVWKADFAQDAYNLQMRIYGKSSIVLAPTRVDVINCEEAEVFFKDGAPPVTATIKNEHYGELTTQRDLTDDEDKEEKE